MGWNPINDLKKAWNKTKKELNDAANSAKRSIEWTANKAKDGVKDAAKTAERGVMGAANKARGVIDDATEHAVGEVQRRAEELTANAEDLVKDALSAVAEVVTAEALSQIRDLVRAADEKMSWLAENKPGLVDGIDSVTFDLQLGPMTLSYDGFYSRTALLAATLDGFVSEPPEFRRGPIVDLLTALGPDSVDLGISVEFALVIGSNELGVGASMGSIPLELATELADVLLEELGVPE